MTHRFALGKLSGRSITTDARQVNQAVVLDQRPLYPLLGRRSATESRGLDVAATTILDWHIDVADMVAIQLLHHLTPRARLEIRDQAAVFFPGDCRVFVGGLRCFRCGVFLARIVVFFLVEIAVFFPQATIVL